MARDDAERQQEDPVRLLAAYLREVRTRAGVTQKAVADIAEVSDSLVTLVEQGRRPPSTQVLSAFLLHAEDEERAEIMALWHAAREKRALASPTRSSRHVAAMPEQLHLTASHIYALLHDHAGQSQAVQVLLSELAATWAGPNGQRLGQLLDQYLAAASKADEALTGIERLLVLAAGTYAEAEAKISQSFS